MSKAKDMTEPLKRLPGQGLRKELDNLFDQSVYPPMMVVFAGFIFLLFECMHAYGGIKPNIWLGVAIALLSLAYAVWRIWVVREKIRNLNRGEYGERMVAQKIEEDLIPLGYCAFHDIPLKKNGKTFNIDHLVIGNNGIFAIETKYYSKPAKGRPEVTYDGKSILWAGKRCKNRDAVAQAKAAAFSARDLIFELTGLKVYVHPVICAVGWYVKSSNLYGNPVLLTMEKTLKSTIPEVKSQTNLSESDRNKIICALKRSAQG